MCVFPINSSACQGLRGAHGETIESFCRVYSIRRQILENVYRRYDSPVGELLQLRELTVELPTAAGWVKPVNGVSLGIPPGESLGLVGESGSGKTMLSLALTPTHRNRPRADPPSEARRCGRTRLGP